MYIMLWRKADLCQAYQCRSYDSDMYESLEFWCPKSDDILLVLSVDYGIFKQNISYLTLYTYFDAWSSYHHDKTEF